jgi:hypothetical protein
MLTFSWPKTEWSSSALPKLVLVSGLVHSLAFVLLQVVPKEKVTAPEREREIEFLSAELPEHQALLAAVEAESPVAALSHQLLSADDLLSRSRNPASPHGRILPLEPPLWKPATSSLAPIIPPPIPRPESGNIRPSKPRIELSPMGKNRLLQLPSLPATPEGRLLENPAFLLGIGGDGTVQFVMLQKSSGDEGTDKVVERALRRLEFKGGQQETQWVDVTFIWGARPE